MFFSKRKFIGCNISTCWFTLKFSGVAQHSKMYEIILYFLLTAMVATKRYFLCYHGQELPFCLKQNIKTINFKPNWKLFFQIKYNTRTFPCQFLRVLGIVIEVIFYHITLIVLKSLLIVVIIPDHFFSLRLDTKS